MVTRASAATGQIPTPCHSNQQSGHVPNGRPATPSQKGASPIDIFIPAGGPADAAPPQVPPINNFGIKIGEAEVARYPNGNLKSAILSANQNVQGIKVKAGDRIELHQNGSVKEATLSAPQTFNLFGNVKLPAGTIVKVDSDGKLTSLTPTAPVTIQGLECLAKKDIGFHQNGYLKSAYLAREQKVTIAGNEITLGAGSLVERDEKGKLKSIELSSTQADYPKGTIFSFDKAGELSSTNKPYILPPPAPEPTRPEDYATDIVHYDNGYLKSMKLLQDHTFNVRKEKVKLAAGTTVSLNEHGQLTSGTLSDSMGPQTVGGYACTAGTHFRLYDNGRLRSAHLYSSTQQTPIKVGELNLPIQTGINTKFHENGTPQKIVLAEASLVIVRVNFANSFSLQQPFPKGTVLTYKPDGNLHSAVLRETKTINNIVLPKDTKLTYEERLWGITKLESWTIQGVTIPGEGIAWFDYYTNLLLGATLPPSDLNNRGQRWEIMGIKFAEFTDLEFNYPNNDRKPQLHKAYLYKAQKVKGKKYPPDTILTFNKTGKIIKVDRIR